VSLAEGDALYWLEYGTRDSLGNYNNDGALWRLGDDGKANAVASELHGPLQLGLATGYAYVFVDGGGYIGSQSSPQLIRVPLAGGASELVQDGATATAFTANGKQAFWVAQNEIFTQALAGGAPSVLLPATADIMFADDDFLYFASNNLRTRARIDGQASQPLGNGNDAFTIKDDSIYAIDSVGGVVLSQAPKSSGVFQRIRALGAGGVDLPPQFANDRYFWNANVASDGNPVLQIRTGTLANMGPPTVLVSRPSYGRLIDSLWVGTSSSVYWTDGQAIYARGIPTK
jgi:hypothetical protein